ncbi:MAG: acyl-CoA dehydrogenase [Desulfobacteraceae bacterium]|nr:MAG: acyl-CoA dehydrogenase [Desulfobacteraceae bacterium]
MDSKLLTQTKEAEMTNNLSNTIHAWCSKNLNEETIRELDHDPARVIKLYRDFTGNGWLESVNIFENPNTFRDLIEIGKILSGYSSAISNVIGVNCVCAMLLTTFGTDSQKEIGRKVLKGDILTCFSLTEPDAGSDIGNLQTTATLEGDHWVLQGKKYLATGAAVADYILVVVRTNPDKPLNKGISLFLVPGNVHGIKLSPQQKIATNSFASCEITFDSVRLPQEMVIGGQDFGWGVITFAGAVERLMVAASCVGLSRRILEYLYEYTQHRMIQGQPLYDIQLINHQLADMAIKIKAADLLLGNAMELLTSGATPTVEICGAKVFASEMQQEISMAAMKIIGGRGYLKEYPVERWMREGLLSLYAGGTNELQKNIIARNMQKDYASKTKERNS